MSTQTQSHSNSSDELLTKPHSNSCDESTKYQSCDSSFSNKRKCKEVDDENLKKDISEDSKKLLPFQKLWTDEDEIFILEEANRYKKYRGLEPNANTSDFHNPLDQSLKQNYSKDQIRYKLRRLKSKYLSHATKGFVKTTPHEKNVFVLSEVIWGSNNKSADQEQAQGNINPNDFISDYSGFIMSRFVQSWGILMKKNLCVVENDKVWRKLAIDEMELLVAKCDAVNENLCVILGALKSSL